MSKSKKYAYKGSKRWSIMGCIVILICIAIVISKFTGFGVNSKYVSNIKSKKVDLTPTNELVLELPGFRYFGNMFYDAVGEFKKQYPNVKVTVTRKGDADNIPTDQYQSAVTSELMAGSGPDLILTDFFTNDLYKTIDTGAFLNLASIISRDKHFNLNDYHSTVMKAGNYRGGQYFMPLSFSTEISVADQSGLDKMGFDKSNVTDYTSFVREISKCIPKAKENSSFNAMFVTPMQNRMLRSSGIPLVDEQKRIALPDEDAVRAFCKAYQPYYDIENQDGAPYSGSTFDLYSKAIIPFGQQMRDTRWIIFWMLIKSKGDTPVLIVPKSVDGGLRATVSSGVAIRAGSPNQLNAWNFIKILLSKSIQNVDPGKNFDFDYPVNKAALRDQFNSYKDSSVDWSVDDGDGASKRVDNSVLTSDDLTQFQKIIDSISCCSLICKPTETIFTKCMEPYFKKEKTWIVA